MDTVTEQTIAQGPVASQEIIKEWGTNGGGFFNANSAHPFENPTPLSNLIEMFCDLCHRLRTHLHTRPDDRFAAPRMGGVGRDGDPVSSRGDSRLLGRGPRQSTARQELTSRSRRMQPGGNMEGKEVRFGIANTALFATVTTDASAARSTVGTIHLLRSAEWSRSSTSCSAK